MVKNNQKIREGIVVSNKMQKTVVVLVGRSFSHIKYGKTITRNKKYYAHTEKDLEIGQKVTLVETRPTSKLKRWRVASLLS